MPKRVFISYSWDSEEHQDWIANLVATLRKYGIQADFDASEVQHNLYQMMVEKIRTYDKILVVVTKRYTEKANNFSGGVGTETKLLLDYFANNESKIVVIRREQCDVPFYLRGYEYIDLNVETRAAIESLVRKINDMPKYNLPSVGPNAISVKSKQVTGFDFDNLIPDLRVATPQGKDEYLKEELYLPKKAPNNDKAKAYLVSRGIDENIIQECIDNDLIYQDYPNNNVVFVGYDNNKNARYAMCRGTNESRYMKEATGSHKAFPTV